MQDIVGNALAELNRAVGGAREHADAVDRVFLIGDRIKGEGLIIRFPLIHPIDIQQPLGLALFILRRIGAGRARRLELFTALGRCNCHGAGDRHRALVDNDNGAGYLIFVPGLVDRAELQLHFFPVRKQSAVENAEKLRVLLICSALQEMGCSVLAGCGELPCVKRKIFYTAKHLDRAVDGAAIRWGENRKLRLRDVAEQGKRFFPRIAYIILKVQKDRMLTVGKVRDIQQGRQVFLRFEGKLLPVIHAVPDKLQAAVNILKLCPAEGDMISICPAVRFNCRLGYDRRGGVTLEERCRCGPLIPCQIHAAHRQRVLAVVKAADVNDKAGIVCCIDPGGYIFRAVNGVFHAIELVDIGDPAPGQADVRLVAPIARNDGNVRRGGRCAVNAELERRRSTCVALAVLSANIDNVVSIIKRGNIQFCIPVA